MEPTATTPHPTTLEEDEMDMLQCFSKHGATDDAFGYSGMDLEGLDAAALDALRSNSPDDDRKKQATSSNKSESPPPERAEALQTQGSSESLHDAPARGRPCPSERYPDDRTQGDYFRRDQLQPDGKGYELRPRRAASRNVTGLSTSESESGTSQKAREPKKLSASDHRRLERNAREQRRSVKIVHQIEELADVLEAAGHPSSKQCKSSVLQAVGDYIHQLEDENAHLEREQCGLVSKIVSIAALARQKTDGEQPRNAKLDYEALFLQSSMPMAVAALDGKFTNSNERFAHVLGLPRAQDVVGRSIFDLASPQHLQHVFSCVGSLLRSAEPVPRGEVHGALADSGRVIAVTLLRPACLTVALIEPVGVDQPRRLVG